MTSLDMRSNSAVMKRAEQLKRWEESETNQAPCVPRPEKGRKIKFSSGCVFLAACSSGDKSEVLSLLENGADINTANVDGLTALHQACIDDNLEMVEFLVEHGADINRQDNEGWTPLHATASCGFVSIARYLVEHGADVAAVNSDGDLAVDLAVDIQHMPMIEYMQKVVNDHNIDLQKARDAELDQMLRDAKQWLRADASEADRAHPKTGATALHVAAAKGYTKVLSLLLAGRVNVDKQDNDGWTPLHAAAHWGQKEAAEMLVNSMADMDIRNYSGLTCIDVAERKMVKFLEELRANNKRTKRRPSSQIRISDTIEDHSAGSKIIRVEMKPDQTKEQANDDKSMPTNDSSATIIPQSTDSQGEDEAPWRRNSLARMRTPNDSPTKNQVPDKDVNKVNTITETSDVILRRTQSFENDEKFYQKYNELRARIKANSCPILPATEISNSNNRNSNSNISNKNKINNNNNNTESRVNRLSSNAPPSSVAFARLYLTTSSASTISPAIATSTTSISPITSTTTTITTNLNTPVHTNTVQRSASLKDHRSIRKQLTSPPASPANVIATSTPAYNTTATANTAAPSGAPIRRSFVPPVRDEESETQRKAHAKRVRETRRSTQGVTLDEIKSAEELVKKKNANMNNNNNSGNNTESTKPISTQENIPSSEQQQQRDDTTLHSEVLLSTTTLTSISSSSSTSTSTANEKDMTKDTEESKGSQLDQSKLVESSLMSSSTSAKLHSNIIVHEENESGNDIVRQERDREKTTSMPMPMPMVERENIAVMSPSTIVRIVQPNTCDRSNERCDDDHDKENEISVNFTIKHPDKVILPTPATTIESVEETVVVPHALHHKRTVEVITDSGSKGNSFDNSELYSSQPDNEVKSEHQSLANERDSVNNLNSSINVQKTDIIEKTDPISSSSSSSTSSSSSSSAITTTAEATEAEEAASASPSASETLKILQIKTLDNNGKLNEPITLPAASSTSSVLVKTNNAATVSPSSMSLPIQTAEQGELFTSASSTPTLESPVRLRDKRSFLDFEKKSSETPDPESQLTEFDEVSTSVNYASNTARNGGGDAESLLRNSANSILSSPMSNCRKATISAGSNVNASSYSGISASERRPSWRLKFSNDSKFKLEDVHTGTTYPPTNSTIIPSAPAVIAAANQRRINSVGNAISSSNQSLNSIGRPVSSPPTAVISHANNNTGSNVGTVLPSGDNTALCEETDNNCNNTVNTVSVADRKFNAASTRASVSTTSSSTTPTMTSSAINSTAKNKEEEKDQGNDIRTALATQAVIQRRRKPKRRSTGVVHLDVDDLDPDRQDSANDAEDKESGSEQRSSRSRVSSSASNSNTSATIKTDTKSQNKSDTGEPDYKALWQAARLENDQLKLELLKKEEQLVQTNAAMSRITNATSKNSLSELEKRERRAMERKLSELEEELKQLDFYKAENLRLKEENGALIRVISKLSK